MYKRILHCMLFTYYDRYTSSHLSKIKTVNISNNCYNSYDLISLMFYLFIFSYFVIIRLPCKFYFYENHCYLYYVYLNSNLSLLVILYCYLVILYCYLLLLKNLFYLLRISLILYLITFYLEGNAILLCR